MLKKSTLNIALLCTLTLGLSVPAFAQKTLAVKGGKVITVSGETIDGGTVVIKDGKISAIGKDVKVPVEAKVIDATGKIVMPGFVEAHSSSAMSQANETNQNVPYVSVVDSIDPTRPYFDEARRNGITSVAVIPGNSTMIGGQGAVIKTGGEFVDYMILKRNAGVKISLRPSGSGSRMGHLAALRKALDAAKEKLNPKKDEKKESKDGKSDKKDAKEKSDKKEPAKDAKASDKKTDAKKVDPKKVIESDLERAMKLIVSGKLPVYIYCDQAMDVSHALNLVRKYGLKPILVLDKNCYKAAAQVARSGFPVILDSEMVFWETDPRTQEDKKIVLTEEFRKTKTPFVFQVNSTTIGSLGTNYFWYQAATAVKHGMPVEDALKALTLTPAKFSGVDKFVGSLEVGKDGDVIVLSGDPLKIDTWVETTIVNGEVVYERTTDEKLNQLLGKKKSE